MCIRDRDGNQNDIAGPSLATDSQGPHDLRLFLANGRRRAAHYIDTRERQFTGENTFDSTINAVELDEENDILISLTGQVIRLIQRLRRSFPSCWCRTP